MKSDIASIALLQDFTDGEFDMFRSAVQLLLGRSFIIRGIEKEEALYDFTIRNIDVFDAWFACASAELKRDEGLGVIAYRGGHETRARFSRDDTCALLVLRLMYEGKRSLLMVSQFPSATVQEFTQKYRAVVDEELKKTKLVEILRRMASCKLIAVPSEPTDPDALMVLYPSLAMTLDRDAIDEILAAVNKGKA